MCVCVCAYARIPEWKGVCVHVPEWKGVCACVCVCVCVCVLKQVLCGDAWLKSKAVKKGMFKGSPGRIAKVSAKGCKTATQGYIYI